jgi:hypothetical protein
VSNKIVKVAELSIDPAFFSESESAPVMKFEVVAEPEDGTSDVRLPLQRGMLQLSGKSGKLEVLHRTEPVSMTLAERKIRTAGRSAIPPSGMADADAAFDEEDGEEESAGGGLSGAVSPDALLRGDVSEDDDDDEEEPDGNN